MAVITETEFHRLIDALVAARDLESFCWKPVEENVVELDERLADVSRGAQALQHAILDVLYQRDDIIALDAPDDVRALYARYSPVQVARLLDDD